MKLPDIFQGLGVLGLDLADVARAALHHMTPKLAKPAFEAGLARASDDAARKLGRLCKMAGEALDRPQPDREEAAGHLARLTGEIKLF